MPSLGEVFIKLGFDVDDDKLKGFQDKIDSVGKEFLVLSATAGGALYGLDRFIRGSVESATALENLHDVTGETTQDLQKWQIAGHLMNMAESVDQIAASIHSVNRAMAEGTLGGNADVFGLLGLSPFGKDGKPKIGTDFLDDLSKNFSTIKQRYSQFGGINKLLPDLQKLGVSEGLYQALQLSDAQREAMTVGLRLSEEQLQKNKELSTSMETMYMQLGQYKDAIVSSFAPDIKAAFDEVVPHVMKVANGLHYLQEISHGTALPITAAIIALVSPLGVAAASAAGLVMALEQLSEIKRVGIKNWGTEVKEGVVNILFDINRFVKGVGQGPMYNGMTMDEFSQHRRYDWQGSRDEKGQYVPHPDSGATVNQTNNFNVHGSGDAASTAAHIGIELNKQNKAAFGQIDMGVRQ